MSTDGITVLVEMGECTDGMSVLVGDKCTSGDAINIRAVVGII